MNKFIKKNKFIYSYILKSYMLCRRFVFEISCFSTDLMYVLKNFRSMKSEAPSLVFVCSHNFYFKKKWQVASQAELWYQFVSENSPAFCGSKLSYFLFFKSADYIVSLEPRYAAPTIYFGGAHKRVIVMVSDSHSKDWLVKYLKKSCVTDILTPYKKTLESLGYASQLGSQNIHSFPWSVPEQMISSPISKARSVEILGFGKSGNNVYDLRTWAFESGLLSIFDYAGSGNYKYKGASYFDWLGRYDACVVAVSSDETYNITVAKYFEVPSQGLLLFAFPSVDLEDFGFEDGVNCIFINKNIFKAKLMEYKLRPEEYVGIRNRGIELIKSKHLVKHRLSYLKYILNP